MIKLKNYHEEIGTVFQQLRRELSMAGLKVMPSFDLKLAREAHQDCTCPRHGSAECNCQVIIMQIYGAKPNDNLTIILSGHDHECELLLEEGVCSEELEDQVLMMLCPAGTCV
ncbi:MAG: hypothetical protein JW750_02450 [Anaerolineaceae bacterium]|nr:hypothetical protein [Anaerolineaceae bacterium]